MNCHDSAYLIGEEIKELLGSVSPSLLCALAAILHCNRNKDNKEAILDAILAFELLTGIQIPE